MSYILALIFGIVPSLIWLFIYLFQDKRPEPRKMIVKVFLLGAFMAVPLAIVLEIIIGVIVAAAGGMGADEAALDNLPPFVFLIYNFVGIAMVEELAKYLVVRVSVLKNSSLDEPVDLMIYMIVSGLGFAALENFLYLMPLKSFYAGGTADIITVSGIRFVGATFLHALASGTLGYFIALSFINISKKKTFWWMGFILASVLHGVFNISIIKADQYFTQYGDAGILMLLIPVAFLIGFGVFIFICFSRLRKYCGACRLEIIRTNN